MSVIERLSPTLRHAPLRHRSTAALLALPLIALAACQPEPRAEAELIRDGDLFLDPETREPYSGPVYSTFADQPLVIEKRLSLRDGAYDGPYEEYFANRQLSTKEVYENGRRHGPYERYFENGQLFEKGTYVRGVPEGAYEAYWESGELYETGAYKDGDFDGPRRWYLNGTLIELVTYAGGTIDGPYERYATDGTLESGGMHRAGAPCGEWIEGGAAIRYAACEDATQ